MRRSAAVRILALFMGAWLPLVQSDAGIFHACMNHGGMAEMSPGAIHGAHSSHAVHGSQTEPAAHQAPGQGEGSGGHTSSQNEDCHCLGQCCVTAVTSIATVDTDIAVTIVQVAAIPPQQKPNGIMASPRVAYLLPFSTAPPVVI